MAVPQKITGRYVTKVTEDSSAEVYANVIEISYTPWDLTLNFCIGSAPSNQEVTKAARSKKSELELPANSVARIRISSRLASELIPLLQTQIEKQKQEFPNP